MKKINVLHILNTTDIGGVERVLLDTCKYADHKKFNLIVVSFQKGALEDEFRKFKWVKKIDLNDSRHFTFKTLKILNKIVKKEKIDVIQTHLQKPELYGFLLKLMNPKIKWAVKKVNTNDYRTKLFWRIANGFILKFSNIVMCNSKGVDRFTRKYEFVSKKKIKIIYEGIDIKKIDERLKKTNTKKLMKQLKIKKDDKIIFSVGRLVFQKGYPYLIKIMKKLPNYKLFIVGSGPEEKKLQNMIKKLGLSKNVKLLGEKNNVIELLTTAKVFCLTSVMEGIPITLMETMYVGVPLVSTKVGGNRELVTHGYDGYLEKSKDIESIKKRIVELMNNKKIRNKFIMNSKKAILKKFSIQVTTKNYENVYEKLLKK